MRAALVLCFVLVGGAGASALRWRANEHFFATQRYEDIYYLPPRAWLPVMSLGYREAFADLIWLEALVYFGEAFHHRTNADHVFDYGEAMVALDPDFRAVYSWVGTAGMYRPIDVTVDDIERATAFLQRGADRYPGDGRLAWELGASYMYELAPRLPRGPAREAAQRRGAPYLAKAARLGAGPRWLAYTSAGAFLRLGQRERALQHLEEMYETTTDDAMRQELARRIDAMRTDNEREAAVETARAFDAERRANYPYLSSTLYLFVGPRLVRQPAEAPSPAP